MKQLTVLQMARQYLPLHTYRHTGYVDIGQDQGWVQLVGHEESGELAIQYAGHIDPCRSPDGMLHELCHALVGPSSLGDEGALMPVQWELMKRLVPGQYERCRRDFADYGITGREDIGSDDSFLQRPLWNEYVQEAIDGGFLNKTGRLRKLRINMREWRGWQRRVWL